jgi:hypothetical protein
LRPPKEDFAALFREPWDVLESKLPGTSKILQYYLRKGTFYVMDSITYLPILPLVADEKGLKTRYPTACLTASNLIQQVLRRAIDHIMVNDPRFSQSLGGSRDVNLKGERGPWYSQDATAATDLHAQWLTQTIYEEIAHFYPELQPYTKYFNKLFGVKKLLPGLSQSDVAPINWLRQYPRAPLLDDSLLDDPNVVTEVYQGHASLILDLTDQWIKSLNALTGVLTKTGQMMGDPTSFPPLMLHTLYCAESAVKAFPYRNSEMKRFHKYLRREDVVLKGVGDDALKPRWTLARRKHYDALFIAMGGRLSYEKCFYHPSKGIIAEVPHEGGFPIPSFSTSVLVAPPGGSKGHVTWSSQAAAIAGNVDRPRIYFSKFLWRSSPYYYTWRLADRLGIPISAPDAWGGISVPLVPHRSTTDHVNWLRYLSQQKISSLIAGVGLSIGEPSHKTFLDESARQWLDQVLVDAAACADAGIPFLDPSCLSDEAMVRKSLKEAYRSTLGRVRAAEFYFRAPAAALSHNPSVRVAVRKFQQKVRSSVPSPVSGYEKTLKSLDEKTSLYFSRGGGYLPDPWLPKPAASYGMEQSGEVKVRHRAPHVKGLG